MGGREAGGLSHILPGYRVVKNPAHRAEVERAWGLPPGSISPQAGRDAWAMIRGLEQDEVSVLWVAATNPAVSMPDLERTKKGPGQVPLHYSAGRLLPHRNGPLCPCAAARRPVGGRKPAP